MLKKMRWRLVAAAMAAMFTVITLLLCVVNALNYLITTRRLDDQLSRLYAESASLPDTLNFTLPAGIEDMGFPQAPFVFAFFAVHCDVGGEITDITGNAAEAVSRERVTQYARDVLQKGSASGFFGDYRYRAFQEAEETTLLFLNAASERQVIRTLLSASLLVELAALLAVFLLVAAFSKRAIAPYARSIERQKRFITDAGHELKTPLTSIATSADVLSAELGDNEWVANIQKQSLRLSRLVGDLVTLSRLDEETPFPEKSDFSLSEAAWEISEPFAALCSARGKTFVSHIEDGLTLHGDRASVQQMLSILLDNAVRYSAPGGRVELDVRKRRRGAVIEVFNTCDLKDVTDLNRLFDRFYRPDASRASDRGGTGVGLSIAKAAAEAHGGKITAESKSGKTIRFRVEL